MNFKIADAVYRYEVYGKGAPVVLLHGFTGSSETWTSYIERWSTKYQIITVDLPGHGKTTTETPKSMSECCHDLKQLFDYLGVSSIHLLGYSMGGRTALSFAINYPAYIKSLILESASPGLMTEDERNKRKEKDEQLAQRVEKEGITAFVDYWESIPLFQTQKKLHASVQEVIRQERLAQTPQGLASSLRAMGTGSQPSWWNNLSTVNKPVLLLVGEQDEKFRKINDKMQRHFPNSEFVVVKNAGHAIHVEEIEIFGKIVEEFIHKNS